MWFRKKVDVPQKKVLYAVTKGDYLGLAVVFINPDKHPINGKYAAILLGGKDFDGGMDTIDIPEVDVKNGLKSGILDKIRIIPKELYKLCCDEYYERLKNKNNTDKNTTKGNECYEFID